MTRKFLFAAPFALAAGALFTAPASAAPWRANPGQLRAEIVQLDRQIDRKPGVSNREERVLEQRVDRLQGLYRGYARGGFSRGEMQSLRREIAAVRAALARQSHDWNNRPGRNTGRNHR